MQGFSSTVLISRHCWEILPPARSCSPRASSFRAWQHFVCSTESTCCEWLLGPCSKRRTSFSAPFLRPSSALQTWVWASRTETVKQGRRVQFHRLRGYSFSFVHFPFGTGSTLGCVFYWAWGRAQEPARGTAWQPTSATCSFIALILPKTSARVTAVPRNPPIQRPSPPRELTLRPPFSFLNYFRSFFSVVVVPASPPVFHFCHGVRGPSFWASLQAPAGIRTLWDPYPLRYCQRTLHVARGTLSDIAAPPPINTCLCSRCSDWIMFQFEPGDLTRSITHNHLTRVHSVTFSYTTVEGCCTVLYGQPLL